MIKVGDTLPSATLMEFSEVEGNGCSIGPNPVEVAKASAGKTIALFALPGAFTPTCSAKHVPGYVEHHDAFKAAGVDEILLDLVFEYNQCSMIIPVPVQCLSSPCPVTVYSPVCLPYISRHRDGISGPKKARLFPPNQCVRFDGST